MSKFDFNYVEIVTGGVNKRGAIHKLPDKLSNIDLDYYGKEVVGGYHSCFMHTQKLLEYTQAHGTVRGYSGSVYSDCLYWDMDNANTEQAKKDTVELVERLKVYSNNIRMYFSGNKGFHVVMITPELENFLDIPDLNLLIKSVCTRLAKGLRSFDNKVYDKTRIIRTPNSKHEVTNLYKTVLTYNELVKLNLDEIKKLAESQRKLDFHVENVINDEIINLLKEASSEPTEKKSSAFLNSTELIDGIMYGFEAGKRNTSLFSFACLLRSRNFDDSLIFALLTAVNARNSSPLPESELDTIIRSVSRYPTAPEYEEVKDDEIVDIKQAGEAWYKIIQSSGQTSFGPRFTHLNERMKMCIPGDTIAFVASSGTGKTTIGLELGNEEAKSQGKVNLTASLEMSRGGIFFRAATIEAVELNKDNYVPSNEVASTLLNGTELRDRVFKNWHNVRIVDKGGLSLDKIVEYFYRAKEIYREGISNLVIDYAQNIENAEDITYAMGMARKFKEVAKNLETKVIILLQTNKQLPDDYTEITKNHIEGCGAYIQAMDYVIAAWRSRENKNRLHAKFIKDRWNSCDYRFDFVREGLKYHTEDYLPENNVGAFAL